ncbi:hypothetical protein AVEN_141160-1 [Araneus ventricosus]|uniref:Uncharacterized protein n=1 Tax=Araneus ventricosus TaxID=182803 RepID=A0A4Y2VB57_ARAVE|nr:hypothetical protein AVEN_141160-1 [Araneus ventricosus]
MDYSSVFTISTPRRAVITSAKSDDILWNKSDDKELGTDLVPPITSRKSATQATSVGETMDFILNVIGRIYIQMQLCLLISALLYRMDKLQHQYHHFLILRTPYLCVLAD